MKYNSPITAHHLLSQSAGGYGIPENIVKLKENTHRAFHTIFQDAHPIQQLRNILQLNRTTLDPFVYAHLSDTIAMYERNSMEIYKPHLFNSDKFIKRHGTF